VGTITRRGRVCPVARGGFRTVPTVKWNMDLHFLTPTDGLPAPGDDPRIDPRIMWPLEYLRIHHGFLQVESDATRLHGDVLRVALERDGARVTVTWVPATEQVFVTQGRRLLGVHTSFPALAAALDRLPCALATAA